MNLEFTKILPPYVQLPDIEKFTSKVTKEQALIATGSSVFAYIAYIAARRYISARLEPYLLKNRPMGEESFSRTVHDLRRTLTYPEIITNTWYHLCDESELIPGKVLEVRALGLVFAVWKDSNGKPVCQDAYCLHLGANLAVGGKVVDGCIECPFHKWKFDNEGCVTEIPYISNPSKRPPTKKLKTYKCVEWCGLICMYYHADDEEPPFELPEFVIEELREGKWAPHLKWDLGFTTLNPVDWVDQAGDHTHFHTLHNEFLIPWTLLPIPAWILKMFPLGICHKVQTYRGDDQDWADRVESTGYGVVNPFYVYFTDLAGLTWNGKPIEATESETTEMFVGPAMMVFKIPFTIGEFKVFVTTLPVEGGSFVRVRTWIDNRVKSSLWIRGICWMLSGISASQLMSDVVILSNKIRPKRPILQPFDGPFNRTNAWLKQFYSANSTTARKNAYRNEW